MHKLSSIYRMTNMCGLNGRTFRVGKVITIAGLVITAAGFALTTSTVSKFNADEYELAHEFVDAVLG